VIIEGIKETPTPRMPKSGQKDILISEGFCIK
jgi:hypothetical protein